MRWGTDSRGDTLTKFKRLAIGLVAVASFLMAAGAGFKNW
jgi:hypothetical protein